ncbi:hypothetical protein CPB86DRAFT_399734 [Serendipita vermifera]|nr:hypothetical protein CPB86DRAFT_399734 [Serendipita vermifera]
MKNTFNYHLNLSSNHSRRFNRMSLLILKDSTVELSTRGQCSLTDVANLFLEVSSNEVSIRRANLSSRNSGNGIWGTDQTVILPEGVTELTVSVFMESDPDGRQLIGSKELSLSELKDTIPNLHELPLVPYEKSQNLILKARIVALEDVPVVGTGETGVV